MSKYRIQKLPSILIIAILAASSLTAFPLMQSFQTSDSKQTGDGISVKDYDKMKNCTTELDKRPTSIEYLTYFNCGRVSVDNDNASTTLREFTLIVEENHKVPISNKGHTLEAWTFNGTVPGPTMRMTEGDHVKITVINSKESKHSHTLHMHSIHPSTSDGVEQPIAPGEKFTYDFIAHPYGVYPYHCHVDPIEDHINRGLYGMMIIDPKTPRENMTEFAMLMNGYDLDLDQEGHPPTLPDLDGKHDTDNEERDNEIYTVNGKAFDYMDNPIKLEVGKPYRIYLVNMLEFDLVNSFHLHGNMFEYYPSGTSMNPSYVNDIVTMSQGDRGILEFTPEYPGRYMFHAHQTEFSELGWMGFFDVGNQTSTATTSVMTMGGH